MGSAGAGLAARNGADLGRAWSVPPYIYAGIFAGAPLRVVEVGGGEWLAAAPELVLATGTGARRARHSGSGSSALSSLGSLHSCDDDGDMTGPLNNYSNQTSVFVLRCE